MSDTPTLHITCYMLQNPEMRIKQRNSADQAGDVDLNDGGLDPEEDGHEALA